MRDRLKCDSIIYCSPIVNLLYLYIKKNIWLIFNRVKIIKQFFLLINVLLYFLFRLLKYLFTSFLFEIVYEFII